MDGYLFCLSIIFVNFLVLRLVLLLYYGNYAIVCFDCIKVVGLQWYWLYIFTGFVFDNISANLLLESDCFVGDLRILQLNNIIVLLHNVEYKVWLTSCDVIHSYCIPNFGVKFDCVPGRAIEFSIKSIINGSFYGQCSELCGVLHGYMPIAIKFV